MYLSRLVELRTLVVGTTGMNVVCVHVYIADMDNQIIFIYGHCVQFAKMSKQSAVFSPPQREPATGCHISLHTLRLVPTSHLLLRGSLDFSHGQGDQKRPWPELDLPLFCDGITN